MIFNYCIICRFWVNHDVFLVNPLLDMLRDIKLFLSKAQDEIIIMDIHRFPVGFKSRKRHHQLLDLLQKEVGDIATPRYFQKSPNGPTLNELWKQKKRLIICYADKTSAISKDSFITLCESVKILIHVSRTFVIRFRYILGLA